MRTLTFLIFFLTICLRNFSQTIDGTEANLFIFEEPEKLEDKIDKIKEFQKENPFNRNAVYHICLYYDHKKIDSVSIFFEDLAKKYPNNAEPWLLRTDNIFFEIDYRNDSLYENKKLEYLKKAFLIDKHSFDVNYELAKLFYNDFIDPYTVVLIDTLKVIDKAKNDYTYNKIDT